MPAACPALDLGGRTVDNPCEVSWLWCTLEDFEQTRALVVLEHNALVRSLNAWNKLVAAGKAKWTPLPTAAWAVYEESWALLQQYPRDYGSGWFDSDIYKLRAPVVAFIAEAQRVHSAACDVNGELAGLGQKLPSAPAKPEEDKGIVAEAVDFAKDVGSGVVKLVGLAVVGVLGYVWLSGRK